MKFIKEAFDTNWVVPLGPNVNGFESDLEQYVGEGKKRYLWLATRMGMPTVKDAPGIEIVQTYDLLTLDQIVGMMMKKLVWRY